MSTSQLDSGGGGGDDDEDDTDTQTSTSGGTSTDTTFDSGTTDDSTSTDDSDDTSTESESSTGGGTSTDTTFDSGTTDDSTSTDDSDDSSTGEETETEYPTPTQIEDEADSGSDGPTQTERKEPEDDDTTETFEADASIGGQGMEERGDRPVGRTTLEDDLTAGELQTLREEGFEGLSEGAQESIFLEFESGAEQLDLDAEDLSAAVVGSELFVFEKDKVEQEDIFGTIAGDIEREIARDTDFDKEDIGVLFDQEGQPDIRLTESGASKQLAATIADMDRVPESAVDIGDGEVDVDVSQVEPDPSRGFFEGSPDLFGTRSPQLEERRTGGGGAGLPLGGLSTALSIDDARSPRTTESVEQESLTELVESVEDFTGVDVPGEGPLIEEAPKGELLGDIPIRYDRPEQTGTRVGRVRLDDEGSPLGIAAPPGQAGGKSGRIEDILREGQADVSQFFGDLQLGTDEAFDSPTPRIQPVEPMDRDSSVRKFTEAGLKSVPQLVASAPFSVPLFAKETGEFAVEPVSVALDEERDFDDFLGDIETRAKVSAVNFGEAFAEEPAQVSGAAVGSLVGTAGVFAGARAVSPVASGVARGAIQPGEEIAGIGGFKATRRIAGERRAQQLFPQQEPLIFSEEAAIMGARRAGRAIERRTPDVNVGKRAGDLARKIESEVVDIKNDIRQEMTALRYPRPERQPDIELEFGPSGEGPADAFIIQDFRPRTETETGTKSEGGTGEGASGSGAIEVDVRGESQIRRMRMEQEFEQETAGVAVETTRPRYEVELETETEAESVLKTEAFFDQDFADAEALGSELSSEDLFGLDTELGTEPRLSTELEPRLDVETGIEQRFDFETELEFETEFKRELELELEPETERELELELETEPEGKTEFEAEAFGSQPQRQRRKTMEPAGDVDTDLFENIPDDLDKALEGLD